ncbi:MAG: biopolymer transporter ExbD [Candidatus Eisenbacteria bacterium]|uniref:Biopolymer transporter ExbD n=1 Tax=Eiseniibacteriota bacterium TaxID=2212470 RepID=A0A7Y2EAS6_UNCEI|nr:biopolymer transporter ExbD [Candidatus Eisenbacteria bacterium]
MARVKRTLGVENKVPTSSMADIAFLLLIFFLATTIFKLEEGLKIVLPRAEAGVRVPRNKVAHIWIASPALMTIDDNKIVMMDIPPILQAKLSDDPRLIVGLNIHKDVPWEIASEAIEMMKEALALNASFTTDPESR